MNAELEYVSDSLFIEKINSLDYFYKEASLASEVFSGVASAVSSFVQNNIDTSSTGSLLKSVFTNLLLPGMFFKAHPILGVVYSFFGSEIEGIFSSIINNLKPKIMSGEKINPEEVNKAASSFTSEASYFHELRELDKQGIILKTAQKAEPVGGSFFGTKGAPLIQRIFGFLGKSKSKNLAVGIVVWFIKTMLLSAGLLTTSAAVKSLIFDKHEPQQEKQEQKEKEKIQQNRRYIKLQNSLENTLLNISKHFYPELNGKENIVSALPEFKKALEIFGSDYDGGNLIALPIGTSEQNIVNTFITSAREAIKGAQ